MPQIIGPWIAGTYDNDRTVAGAARQSFSETFGLEKLKKVWEVYRGDILEYTSNIITNEQVNTLSDERQVTKEDAEAKFARVISACIAVLRHLLSRLWYDTEKEHIR